MKKKWHFEKLGRAFDTIKRNTILDVIEDAGGSVDDLRLVRILLAETQLQVKVGKNASDVFETTIGSLQGDSLSGIFYLFHFVSSCRFTSGPFPSQQTKSFLQRVLSPKGI